MYKQKQMAGTVIKFKKEPLINFCATIGWLQKKYVYSIELQGLSTGLGPIIIVCFIFLKSCNYYGNLR